jgi:hypothetical protein
VTGYGLDDRDDRVRVPEVARIFSYPRRSDRLGLTQRLVQRVHGAVSPRIKRPGRDANHSSQARAEVKNVNLYIHSPMVLHGIVLN